jgi:hypothetical protein
METDCRACTAQSKTPHPADPITVRPTWLSMTLIRCRSCSERTTHINHLA